MGLNMKKNCLTTGRQKTNYEITLEYKLNMFRKQKDIAMKWESKF